MSRQSHELFARRTDQDITPRQMDVLVLRSWITKYILLQGASESQHEWDAYQEAMIVTQQRIDALEWTQDWVLGEPEMEPEPRRYQFRPS